MPKLTNEQKQTIEDNATKQRRREEKQVKEKKTKQARTADPIEIDWKNLTAKQHLFVSEYIVDFNGTRAATAAGVPEKDAEGVSGAWLTQERFKHVQLEIKKVLEDFRSKCKKITAERVVEEVAKIGLFNVKNIFSHEGNLLDINEMPDEVSACIKKYKVRYITTGWDEEGNEVKEKVIDIEFWDKMDALRQLAQHLGLMKDVIIQNNGQMIINNGEAKLLKWEDLYYKEVKNTPQKLLEKDPIEQKIKEVEGKVLN